ncbi:MAG: diguanylate cyclase [Oscillospiraceae bacterium]|nr:diguanylate cyclase [Oscillospiraceae bacterium]
MAGTRDHSVLIVDDESSNIMAITHILSPNYIVYAAKNGQSGIKAAHKYLPDIILLDVIMPEMDGYSVIAALKDSDATHDIPVIFITGLSGVNDEEKGLALGAADYISKPFSPSIVKLRVNNQIRMIEQIRTIERLSMTDQLTELPNRRSFNLRLEEEWERAVRNQSPVSILLADVDRFKNYNDTYGHQQGDAALQAVAGALMGELQRPGDFAARWGGEEFAVLLTDTDLTGAQSVAEKIRLRIEGMEIPRADGRETRVTISIGISTQIPPRNSAYDDFITCADKALYLAKETGRNRVCTADIFKLK